MLGKNILRQGMSRSWRHSGCHLIGSEFVIISYPDHLCFVIIVAHVVEPITCDLPLVTQGPEDVGGVQEEFAFAIVHGFLHANVNTEP